MHISRPPMMSAMARLSAPRESNEPGNGFSTLTPDGAPSRSPIRGSQALAELGPGLPPDFMALLTELAQFIDIDGDGTPDIAVLPLGGNAMANAMSRRGGF